MAKQQHDREDLLREATALVVRAELQLNSDAHPVVAGFRQGGEASFYFGFDPVFQFNSERQLRRAFYDGRLIKAEQGELIALARQREQSGAALVRRPCTAEETAALLHDCRRRLDGLADALRQGRFEVVGEVSPGEASAVSAIERWLAQLEPQISIAARPNVAG